MRFHLYINTAPCGDARIFSPHESSSNSNSAAASSSSSSVLSASDAAADAVDR